MDLGFLNFGHIGSPAANSLAMFSGPGFFQVVWTNTLGSLAGSWITGSIQGIAYGIIITLLVVSIYAAFARGNGFRDVFVALAWAVGCAAIVYYWQTLFSMASNDAFGLANKIGSGDYFTNVAGSTISTSQGTNIFSSFKLLNPLNDIAVFCNFIAVVVTVVSYYLVYYLMIIAFMGWGVVLYGVGPLLIALMPFPATRSLGKEYLTSLGQWALWPFLYSLFSMVAALINSIPNPSQMSGLGVQTVVTSMSQVFIAFVLIAMTATIPFIAAKVLKGDFSGSMGNAMTQTAASIKDFAKGAINGIPSGGGSGGGGSAGGPGGSGPSGPGGSGGGSFGAPEIGPPPPTPGLGPGGGAMPSVLGPPGATSGSGGGYSGAPPALSSGGSQHLLTDGSAGSSSGAAAGGSAETVAASSTAAASTAAETAASAAIIVI